VCHPPLRHFFSVLFSLSSSLWFSSPFPPFISTAFFFLKFLPSVRGYTVPLPRTPSISLFDIFPPLPPDSRKATAFVASFAVLQNTTLLTAQISFMLFFFPAFCPSGPSPLHPSGFLKQPSSKPVPIRPLIPSHFASVRFFGRVFV